MVASRTRLGTRIERSDTVARPTGTAPAGTGRRHDLDVLRVIAVALLFPFHCAQVFDTFDPFYLKSAARSAGLSWSVIAFLNPWHMPLLFVLAGAATWFALGHRSARAYVRERTLRLLIPFVFGVLVIVPPQAYLAMRWRGIDVSPGTFLRDYWSFEGEILGYGGGWTPGHLWFIGFLFVLSLVALPAFLRWRRTGPPRWSPWYLAGLPLVLLVADGMPSPEDGPQNPFFALVLFVAGFLLIADRRSEAFVHRHRRELLIAAIVAMTICVWVWAAGIDDRWADGSAGDIAFGLVERTNTWLWVLAILGLGHAYLDRPYRWLPWANEGAYPVYILHQTVIVAVAYVVLGWGLGVPAAYTTLLVLSIAATLAIYAVAVRPWRITRFLFGMKPLAR